MTKRFHRQLLPVLMSALLLGGGALAQETPSVEEIVARTNHVAYYQGEDGRAQVNMTITDAQGRTREREFTILRKNMDTEDRAQRFYVHFRLPADVRDMVFMVWKHVGSDDDRWLYLPSLDVTRRIAASDERTSFVGSHFFYEDVSGRSPEEDVQELVEVTDTYYVLKNTPRRPDRVEFDSFTMWIHKDTFLPVRISYEQGGEVYREYEVLQVEEVQGFMTVTQSRMKDLRNGGETTLSYASVEYNTELPEDIFTERYLRRAPREFLQ